MFNGAMKQEISEKQILESFGRNVRRYRKERSLSQEQLGDKCQLDRTYIGSVERGERNIGLVNIYRIANALQLDVRELFVRDE